jgi:undecaprenyl-diphosphatase
MAHLPYRTFALWNALGGTVWAVSCVIGGYLAGDVIGHWFSDVGWVVVGIAVLALLVHLVRSRRERATSDPSES